MSVAKLTNSVNGNMLGLLNFLVDVDSFIATSVANIFHSPQASPIVDHPLSILKDAVFASYKALFHVSNLKAVLLTGSYNSNIKSYSYQNAI